MKKFDFKSFLLGIIVASVGVITVLTIGQIKLAIFSNAKIMLDSNIVELKNPLVATIKGGKKDSQIYMPVGELFNHLGYTVAWNSNDNTINLINANIEETIESSKIITDNKNDNIQVYEHGIGENGKSITKDDYYKLNKGDMLVFNLYKLNDGNMVNDVYKERQDLNLKIGVKNPTGIIESETFINLANAQKNIAVEEDGQYEIIISNPQTDTIVNFKLSVEKQSS
jgi:hypothetical protein